MSGIFSFSIKRERLIDRRLIFWPFGSSKGVLLTVFFFFFCQAPNTGWHNAHAHTYRYWRDSTTTTSTCHSINTWCMFQSFFPPRSFFFSSRTKIGRQQASSSTEWGCHIRVDVDVGVAWSDNNPHMMRLICFVLPKTCTIVEPKKNPPRQPTMWIFLSCLLVYDSIISLTFSRIPRWRRGKLFTPTLVVAQKPLPGIVNRPRGPLHTLSPIYLSIYPSACLVP